MSQIVEYNTQEFKTIVSKYERIYLFGAGGDGKKMIEFLTQIGISITAVIVSDKKNNPENLLGIEVKELHSIQSDSKNLFVMGVSRVYEEQVAEILEKKGHSNIVKISDTKWNLNAASPKLEITAKIGCSIQCKFCPQKELLCSYFKEDKERAVYLSLENLKKAVDHMPENTVITFSGFCEPFLNPQAVEMIKYANQKGHRIELYTTFSKLTLAEFEQIKDIPFEQVVLHTPDKMNYANIPVTDEYKQILNMALEHRKVNGEPFIDSANCQSEPSDEFLEIAKGRILVESTLHDRAGLLEGEELKKSGKKTGKLVCQCSYLQNHWVLLPDGTVTLCCMDFGMKHTLGNLLYEDYQTICDNQAYKKLRTQMEKKGNERDLLCGNCTASVEISKN